MRGGRVSQCCLQTTKKRPKVFLSLSLCPHIIFISPFLFVEMWRRRVLLLVKWTVSSHLVVVLSVADSHIIRLLTFHEKKEIPLLPFFLSLSWNDDEDDPDVIWLPSSRDVFVCVLIRPPSVLLSLILPPFFLLSCLTSTCVSLKENWPDWLQKRENVRISGFAVPFLSFCLYLYSLFLSPILPLSAPRTSMQMEKCGGTREKIRQRRVWERREFLGRKREKHHHLVILLFVSWSLQEEKNAHLSSAWNAISFSGSKCEKFSPRHTGCVILF